MGSVWPVPREARTYQGHRAGLVTRGLAAAVDALVVVGLVVGLELCLNGIRLLLDPRGFELTPLSGVTVLGESLAVAVLYLSVTWAIAGRSYGCHVLGLRVLGRGGRPPGVAVATLRAVLCVLFPWGLLWCAVGASRRSLQDLLLGTSAVYDWLPGPASSTSGPPR